LATDKSVKAIQYIDPEFSDFLHEMEIDYDSLRAITALRFDMDTSEESIPTEMIDIMINAIGSSAITPEEQALGNMTRKKLRNLSTWNEWKAGEIKQSDQMHSLRMYGEPCKRPPDAIVL
jgi:hypothetical protein